MKSLLLTKSPLTAKFALVTPFCPKALKAVAAAVAETLSPIVLWIVAIYPSICSEIEFITSASALILEAIVSKASAFFATELANSSTPFVLISHVWYSL